MKLSHSCLPIVEQIISKHNRKVLKRDEEVGQCNCQAGTCPVEGACQTSGVVYKATVKTEDDSVFKYVGLTEEKFKERFRKHQSSFRTRNKKNKTNLSEKIYGLGGQKCGL